MNVLKGYKETEIGLLPTDWELKSVGTHCIVKARIGWQGLRSDEYLSSGKYGLITSTDIVDGRVNWGSCCFVSKSRYLQDSNIIVREDDTLVSKDGTIGKVGIVQNIPFPSTLNSGVFVIRPKFDDIYKKYLAFAFKSVYFQDFINRLTAGSTIVHLYQKDIVNFKFPVPPPLEQRAIAEVLSDVDGLIGALDKKIAKKRLLKQGAMQQLLTGKKRLHGFTDKWVEITFREYVDIYRGGSPRPIESYITDSPNGVNWIKIGDVKPNDKYINKTEERIIPDGVSRSRRVDVGDFILSNSMSFGRPYILGIDGCIHDGWLVIQNYHNSFDKDYLYYLLCSEDVMMQYIGMAAGSSVKNLNKEKVASLQLCVPTTIEEQQAIATILSDMDKEIADLEAQRDKYRLLKSGMMQKLLTGQIRLKTK